MLDKKDFLTIFDNHNKLIRDRMIASMKIF
jgi:hypothetical protein